MSGARTTSESSSWASMSARTRSNLASSRDQLIEAKLQPRGHVRGTVPRTWLGWPGGDWVAEDADPLDLALHHVAGLEIQRRGVFAEPRHVRHRSRREHVARAVAERRVVGDD